MGVLEVFSCASPLSVSLYSHRGGLLPSRSRSGRSVFEVFTPTTQARVNFVERDTVNDRLVDALRTPGKQIVIYGDSGCGKSTLLQRKLEQLYENHITTRCSAASTFISILLDTFDQLDTHYVESRSTGTSDAKKSSLHVELAKVKAAYEQQVSSSMSSTTRRAVPLQLTTQRLAELMGTEHLCWIIEDFHKVPNEEKVPLAQAFKIFSDMGSRYSDLRIVAIGATDTAREVVEYDREMANRITEILVPLMTDQELIAILRNGERLMNCSLDALESDIVRFSSGLPSVCHHLALNACLSAGLEVEATETRILGDDDLKTAISRYVDESSDTVKGVFDQALRRYRIRKYDNCKLILTALAKETPVGLQNAEILSAIREVHPEYPQSNLTSYLRELTSDDRGAVLKQGLDGRYRFADPLYYAYAQALFRPTGRVGTAYAALETFLSKTFVTSLEDKVLETASTWKGRWSVVIQGRGELGDDDLVAEMKEMK